MNINVGILNAPIIRFQLHGIYTFNGENYTGAQQITIQENKLLFNNNTFQRIEFLPTQPNTDSFLLHDVIIGIGFHWEQKEDQAFCGQLHLLPTETGVQAINSLDVEEYLISVISSEMSATSSLELLKAHAIISRSWVAAPILNTISNEQTQEESDVKWYERDAHHLFDVCADDHCQRYQGITRASTQAVRQAVQETRGMVLTYGDNICDARFSKCCGGIAETFENCWAPIPHPYLVGLEDTPHGAVFNQEMTEHEARLFIEHKDETCFCNTNNKEVLSQVLNNYDQETPDFYRWQVRYTPQELSELIARKSGIDYGDIIEMTALQRGVSGRIVRLLVKGTKHSAIVGKELEIRRLLSESHLYSSAFVIDRTTEGDFLLTGAGWGHGVGLCQIGAAMMAHQGYSYQEILMHYYRGAAIEARAI